MDVCCINDATGISSFENNTNLDDVRINVSISEVIGTACISSMIKSLFLNDYKTRKEIFSAIEYFKNIFTLFIDFLERIQKKYNSELFFNQYFAQSNTYQQLRSYILLVFKDIQRRALDLKIEKTIYLKADTHYFNVIAEYYQTMDEDTITFFEETNNIHGDDFFLLRKGRSVTVYV